LENELPRQSVFAKRGSRSNQWTQTARAAALLKRFLFFLTLRVFSFVPRYLKRLASLIECLCR
jgi:hypothetical protein